MDDLLNHLSNDTIHGILINTAKKLPDKPALIYRKDHCFESISYKRLVNLVQNFTLSLEKLGVKRGERVVLISENRPEWVVADLSTGSLGAILVPINGAKSKEQVKFITYETCPILLIVSNAKSFIKASQVKKELDIDIPVIYFNDALKGNNNIEIDSDDFTFIEALRFVPHHNVHLKTSYIDKIKNLIASDTVSITYTVGGDGKYRGVELSHNEIIANANDAIEVLNINSNDKFLSVLPLSHAFEKTAGCYVPLFSGATIRYVDDLSKFINYAKEEKPTIILAVPYLYEKMRENITRGAQKNIISKTMFNLSLNDNGNGSQKIKHKIINPFVLKKIQKSFGGNLRFFISGGAALDRKTGLFFDRFGLPVLEGYGLTEASPIVSVNTVNNNKYGTVGQPLPKTQVKLSDDGEILVKGPNVMKGYYKEPKENEIIFDDGWLKTGDIGEIDENGFLKIIGRKKEILVLSTGQNVAPRAIEQKLNHSKYILQSLVFGDGQKYISALIVPNFNILIKTFQIQEKDQILNDSKVIHFLKKEISKQLSCFSPYEKVKKFILIKDKFNIKNGFLTQNDELKRDIVLKNYQKEIMALYKSH